MQSHHAPLGSSEMASYKYLVDDSGAQVRALDPSRVQACPGMNRRPMRNATRIGEDTITDEAQGLNRV